MYCKTCGTEYPNDQAVICLACGVEKGRGTEHCQSCGAETQPGAAVCLKCGTKLTAGGVVSGDSKSKLVARLLAIFVGTFGIHNFYLGYMNKGIIQLVVSVVGIFLCGLPTVGIAIWALVEGIFILTGKINVDAKGNMLKD